MTDSSFIELINARGRKREKAVQSFIEDHVYLVRKMCRTLKISEHASNDCFSDAIVEFIKQISNKQFRGESKLSSYFYRIFYNKCVDFSRKKTTNTVTTENFPNLSTTDSPIEEFEIKQDFLELKKKLDLVGEQCKNILLDWGYFGYSMIEIAERNGIENSKKAKDKKYKCLKKLRKLINA